MNERLSRWLNKELLPRRKSTPSPFVRKTERIAGITFLIVLSLFWLWRILLFWDVHSRLSRIRAAGLPISGAELNVWRHPPPDEENGSLVLTQAFALLHTFPDSRSNEIVRPEILRRTNEWSAATRALVAEYARTNAPVLAKAREALRLPRFLYPLDFSYGPDTPMPHLNRLKAIARLAALQSALDADGGRTDQWPEQVELQLKLACTLDEEPLAISHLVRERIIQTAVTATERGLNRATPNGEACEALQSVFRQIGETNLLPRALIGERAISIPIFRLSTSEIQHFSQDQEPGKTPPKPQRFSGKPKPILWLTGLFERDLDFFLKTMEKSVSLAGLPPPQSLTLTNYLEAAQKTAQKRYYILSPLFLSTLGTMIVHEASLRARIELATTALAVERFRRERDKLPDNLGQLIPGFLKAVPTDPFDGAPLRYQQLPKGYIIYSVGADGHDDGGREPPESRKSTDKSSYDITFIVEH